MRRARLWGPGHPNRTFTNSNRTFTITEEENLNIMRAAIYQIQIWRNACRPRATSDGEPATMQVACMRGTEEADGSTAAAQSSCSRGAHSHIDYSRLKSRPVDVPGFCMQHCSHHKLKYQHFSVEQYNNETPLDAPVEARRRGTYARGALVPVRPPTTGRL